MSATPLQWEELPDAARYIKHIRRARPGDGYCYDVAYYSHSGLWASRVGGDMELEDGSVFPFEKLIYEGDDGPAAVAAAESHHAARTRRLAWERYMAENDPPEDGKRCE